MCVCVCVCVCVYVCVYVCVWVHCNELNRGALNSPRSDIEQNEV